MIAIRLIFAVFAAIFSVSGVARAAAIADTEYSRTEIIPETAGFVPGETTWFAIRQEVRDGWHVFWKNPGDAGLPLDLNWSFSSEFTVGEIVHPVPHFIPVGPFASFAHEGAPIFLIPVTTPADALPGELINVVIDASWQICEEICVPEDARFEFSLPVLEASSANSAYAGLFDTARARLPVALSGAAEFSQDGSEYRLTLSNPDQIPQGKLFFFPEPDGLVEPAAVQQVGRSASALTVTLKPGYLESYEAASVDGVLAVLEGADAGAGFSLSATLAAPISAPKTALAPTVTGAGGSVPLLLLMAFFGGLILNVMPCVFPIIFIKAAAVMNSAHAQSSEIKRDGMLYTGGVVATFALLGGALLVLRAGGEQLGWGFHLQSPVIVALSVYILLLVGLNLSGLFTIGESLAGRGDRFTQRGGALGAFFTGALAVVVAAPCIGPLLSAPMGAALLQPAAIGMLIFILMALGLAAPFLALSFVPSLGKLLPKPGPWMATFKQALAFPVFAAAAYFLWVFAQQSGGAGLGRILAGGVFLALAAWLFEKSKGEGTTALVLRALSAVAVIAALAPLTRVEAVASASSAAVYGELETEPYDAASIASYQAQGTPVFVDFTAAWCLTCQFNKMTVLQSADVQAAFVDSRTVMMIADWTVRDPEITEALQAFGASGVPLYVYYPAGGQAEILPLPLTKKDLLAVLDV